MVPSTQVIVQNIGMKVMMSVGTVGAVILDFIDTGNVRSSPLRGNRCLLKCGRWCRRFLNFLQRVGGLCCSTWNQWIQYLCDLPSQGIAHLRVLAPCSSGWCDIFTDGSCLQSDDSYKRLASWGLVQGFPQGSGTSSAVVLGQGVLPGLLQTSFRSELLAAILAIELAAASGMALRLWTDNEAVAKGLRKLVAAGRPRGCNEEHNDLWKRAYNAIVEIGEGKLRVTHVYSHQSGDQDTLADEWIVAHNSLVDRVAGVANRNRPDAFWAWYKWHCQQLDCVRRINGEVQRSLLAVSQAVFRTTRAELEDEDGAAWENLDFVPPVGVEGRLHMEPVISAKLVSRYGKDYLTLLFSWLVSVREAVAPQDSSEVWISSYQMFLDFVMSTGHCGVLQVDQRWNCTGDHTLLLAQHTFKTRCRWWTKSLSDLVQFHDGWFDRRWTRPKSEVLCLHCGCWWMRWSHNRLGVVDRWLSGHLRGVATRGGAALQTLNPAKHGSLEFPRMLHVEVR